MTIFIPINLSTFLWIKCITLCITLFFVHFFHFRMWIIFFFPFCSLFSFSNSSTFLCNMYTAKNSNTFFIFRQFCKFSVFYFVKQFIINYFVTVQNHEAHKENSYASRCAPYTSYPEGLLSYRTHFPIKLPCFKSLHHHLSSHKDKRTYSKIIIDSESCRKF